MPDYSIYVLDESDVTINGAVLDGVNQGSGVHLQGVTMTINAPNWTQINVTDNDDNFQDSDASQVLNGAQEVDGVTYASGTSLEAEYGFTVTDGTNTWQLIGFNVNQAGGGNAYGSVEGIAVIGGPGGFPPSGVTLTVNSTQEGPNYLATDYATPICFAAQTQVVTHNGPCPIGDVSVGDQIRVADGRMETVRWIGKTTAPAKGAYAPVCFAKGAFGAQTDIEVSQQHRVLVRGWQAELMFGETEVLVPAAALLNDHNVRLRQTGHITFVHVLFDRHELIDTDGFISESLHPGPVALSSVGHAARAELLRLFPDIEQQIRPLCRPALRRHDATVLA